MSASPDSLPLAVRSLAEEGPVWSNVHLVGVGGIGMAGLAVLLRRRGCRVSGCDAVENPLFGWLRPQGIVCTAGHDPAHLENRPEWIVRSPAVSLDHPELLEARRQGIPVVDRGRVLPLLLRQYRTVAVAGTHGKTTTATMVAWILQYSGRPVSYCIGGISPLLGPVARVQPGDLMVVEADESDGTLQYYAPEVAVITNMDLDHVDYYQNEESLRCVYGRFIRQSRIVIIPWGEKERLAPGPTGQRRITYGVSGDADIRADAVEEDADGISFDLVISQQVRGRVRLGVPGRHNLLNALAATAAVLAWGVPAEAIAPALALFRLPRRRYETVALGSGIRVISDYAHHPAEIRALLAQARLGVKGRLVAVFQPHRYSRTKAFKDAFVRELTGLDHLVLVPVYAASEPLVEGGTTLDLLEAFRQQGIHGVVFAENLEAAWSDVCATARAGDVVLVIGAGDVEKIGQWAAAYWNKG